MEKVGKAAPPTKKRRGGSSSSRKKEEPSSSTQQGAKEKPPPTKRRRKGEQHHRRRDNSTTKIGKQRRKKQKVCKRKERPPLDLTVVYLLDINLIVAISKPFHLSLFSKVTSISFHPKEGRTAAPTRRGEKGKPPQGREERSTAQKEGRNTTLFYSSLTFLCCVVLYLTLNFIVVTLSYFTLPYEI